MVKDDEAITTILVTGGCGFIGSHLVETVLSQHPTWRIRIIDNLRTGKPENAAWFEKEPNVKVVIGSILDRQLVAQCVAGVDYIFHFAAFISVPESMSNPLECVQINTEGTIVLLEEAAKAKVKKFMFSSTSAVYGASEESPKKEAMSPTCLSPYGMTKADGEFYTQMFNHAGKVPGVVLRYFNVFGPRQDPNSQYAAVIPAFVSLAVQGRDLNIFGDGEQTRDFVSVKDIVSANLHAAKTESMNGKIFNVGYGKAVSVNSLAKQIFEIVERRTGKPVESRIVNHPPRSGDTKHSMADVSRLFATGWEPTYSFETAMEETVDYFLKLHGKVMSGTHA
eukprot:ANDGO_02617.mRNA.1 Putative UDP-glucose 4-epimerase